MNEVQKLEQAINLLVESLDPQPPAGASVALEALANLVSERGQRVNLSGHRTTLAICEALIGDAIGVLREVERFTGQPVAGRVIDLGSGAGFPGLPWAIVRPSTEVDLVEIREKRHFFQRAACREIGIANAHPIRARIEDHAVPAAPLVIAQAVGPIEEVIPAMQSYVMPGGLAIVPGSVELDAPRVPEEFDAQVIEYRSPILDQPRRVWIGRLSAG